MGVRFLLILVALIGLMWLASWLSKANPQQRKKMLQNIVLYGLAIAVLIMVFTGRAHWLFAIAAAAVPWLQRGMMAMRAWNTVKSFRGPSPNQQSSVNTAWLAMTLDHETGNIDGEILSGQFKGSRLSVLSFEQLMTLLDECRRQDAQSVPLVEAFIDQTFGPEWRGDDAEPQAQAESMTGPMNRAEALAILGLEEGASHKEIRNAHRSLMQKMHPDRGGSAFLASRINQARDLLLDDQS